MTGEVYGECHMHVQNKQLLPNEHVVIRGRWWPATKHNIRHHQLWPIYTCGSQNDWLCAHRSANFLPEWHFSHPIDIAEIMFIWPVRKLSCALIDQFAHCLVCLKTAILQVRLQFLGIREMYCSIFCMCVRLWGSILSGCGYRCCQAMCIDVRLWVSMLSG